MILKQRNKAPFKQAGVCCLEYEFFPLTICMVLHYMAQKQKILLKENLMIYKQARS